MAQLWPMDSVKFLLSNLVSVESADVSALSDRLNDAEHRLDELKTQTSGETALPAAGAQELTSERLLLNWSEVCWW